MRQGGYGAFPQFLGVGGTSKIEKQEYVYFREIK
tara:strand:+ start:1051 stop:1152 length:102 start_codon:yes stop_codon:yes gene_type:complete